MTDAEREARLRQVLEAEDGSPVSAGVRVEHVLAAIADGRAHVVNLSRVPEAHRPAVIDGIQQLVALAVAAHAPEPAAAR